MLILSFDTWEEFDKAIGSIATLENSLANGVSNLTMSEETTKL
jgi:hypothetical protein